MGKKVLFCIFAVLAVLFVARPWSIKSQVPCCSRNVSEGGCGTTFDGTEYCESLVLLKTKGTYIFFRVGVTAENMRVRVLSDCEAGQVCALRLGRFWPATVTGSDVSILLEQKQDGPWTVGFFLTDSILREIINKMLG